MTIGSPSRKRRAARVDDGHVGRVAVERGCHLVAEHWCRRPRRAPARRCGEHEARHRRHRLGDPAGAVPRAGAGDPRAVRGPPRPRPAARPRSRGRAARSASSGWQSTGRSLGSSRIAVSSSGRGAGAYQHGVDALDDDLGRLGQLDERVARPVRGVLDGRSRARPGRASGPPAGGARDLDQQRRVADQRRRIRSPKRTLVAVRATTRLLGRRTPGRPRAVGVGAAPRAAARRGAPGERVLDLGCGAGRFVAALRDAGADAGRRRARRGGARARARATSPAPTCGCSSPTARCRSSTASVDLVWCSEVLEHVADTAHLLLEVRRVLRPGGRLLVTVPYHGRVKARADRAAALRRALRPARPAPALLHAPLARRDARPRRVRGRARAAVGRAAAAADRRTAWARRP